MKPCWAPRGNGWGGAPMLDLLRAKMPWIVLEWWVWGFNPVSNLYFIFGLAEVAAGIISLSGTTK